jgi:hypothetical protein
VNRAGRLVAGVAKMRRHVVVVGAWDNRITQHCAPDDYDDLPRRIDRVTIAGDVPIGVDGARSYVLEGDAAHYTPSV